MTTVDEALADIDRIPWDQMVHCRGSAADVPGLLRTLFGSPTPEERRKATSHLFDRLLYQGSIFEPTAHVIPFMVKGLPLLPEAEQAQVVQFLSSCANGNTMTEGSGVLHFVQEDDPDRPAMLAQYELEKRWLTDVRQASWAALPAFQARIDSSDRRVSLAVPYALASLFGEPRTAKPPPLDERSVAQDLCARLFARAERETDRTVQAGLIFALGSFLDLVPENSDRFESALVRLSPPAQLAAAINLLRVRTRDDLVDFLVAALRARALHQEWFPAGFPWLRGHARFTLMGWLCSDHVTDSGFERAFPAILEVLARDASGYTFDEDALPPLLRAMGPMKVTPATRRKDLPQKALAALDTLYDNRQLWASRTMNSAHRFLGLSHERPFWTTMLERTPEAQQPPVPPRPAPPATPARDLGPWERIALACENDDVVEGTVLQAVAGGFTVDIGVKAHLPETQADLRPVSPGELVGKRLKFKIIKFNRRREEVVLSRRVILQGERDALKAKTLPKVSIGAVLDGVVKSIAEYGAFIDVGSLEGLLHITNVAWEPVSHPSDVLAVGSSVRVVVLKFVPETESLSLGMKQLKPQP